MIASVKGNGGFAECWSSPAWSANVVDMEICRIIPSPVLITPQLSGSTGIFKSSTVYRIDLLFNGADILISNKGRINSRWGAK